MEVLNFPLQDASISGQAVYQFDRYVQSEVFCLSSKSRLSFPKNMREQLEVFFGYLVFQIFVPSSKQFAIEISLFDSTSTRRRLCFVNCMEMMSTFIQARIPHKVVAKDRWANVCVDLQSFVRGCWGTDFHFTESFQVAGTCRLRRVFAVKYPLQDSLGRMKDQPGFTSFPPNFDIPITTAQITQRLEYCAASEPRPGASVVPRPKKKTHLTTLPKVTPRKAPNPFQAPEMAKYIGELPKSCLLYASDAADE